MVKLGRNYLCHCGSNKKYKKCCESKELNKKTVENLKEKGYKDLFPI